MTTKGGHECPSVVDCQKECKHGRLKSLNGCELCECFDPCEDVKCDENEVCQIENEKATCKTSKQCSSKKSLKLLHNRFN